MRKISKDRVGKSRKQKNKIIGTVDANPCTKVYKVVEYLNENS